MTGSSTYAWCGPMCSVVRPPSSLRPVARIIVQKRPAAFELVLEVREPRAGRSRVLVIASAHGEREPVAGRYDDACRPQLDVERNDLARLAFGLEAAGAKVALAPDRLSAACDLVR